MATTSWLEEMSIRQDRLLRAYNDHGQPPEDARIVAEEHPGPVMPLMKFSSEEEVIQRANNSEYGLAGAVWTANPDKGVEIAEQLETGTVWINEYLHLSPFALIMLGTQTVRLWCRARPRGT